MSGKLAPISTLGVWVGALGFLPWLKATYARARVVTESPALEEEWRRGTIVGFFIPFVNLVRPYNVVKVLDDALDPDLVPAPAPKRVETGALYRDAAAAFTSPVLKTVKHAPVGLWWAFSIGRVVAQIAVSVSRPATNLKIALAGRTAPARVFRGYAMPRERARGGGSLEPLRVRQELCRADPDLGDGRRRRPRAFRA